MFKEVIVRNIYVSGYSIGILPHELTEDNLMRIHIVDWKSWLISTINTLTTNMQFS